MDKKTLIKQLKSGKTEPQLEKVEFKRSWSQSHGKKISAIANQEGIVTGWVVVGMEDNGQPSGHDLKWLTETEHAISNHIREYLEPSWAVKSISSEEVGTGHIILIEIENPQDVVKWNGTAYKLIGTQSFDMKEHEVMALSLKLPGTDFSKIKYKGGYDASLITSFAKKVIENSNDFQIDTNSMSPLDILRTLNIYETNTAGILFGDFPCRIVHFDEDGDILDQKEIKGLYHVISNSFIEEIQSRARTKGTDVSDNSLSAKEETPYPIKALREVLANAVAHALYQKNNGDIVVETHPNRITVRNNCTKEAEAFVDKWFSRINKSTNKHLMNTLRIPRITDEQGTGKIRIFRLMLEAGKREPVMEFQNLGDYARWSVTLYNEEGNIEINKISNEIKDKFKSKDEWRIATALLLWREQKWSKIETFLDDHFKYVANQVIKNQYSPVSRYDDKLYTKRWAEIRLTGQVTKQFTEAEKEFWLKLLNGFSFRSGAGGNITSAEARKIIGLSDSSSEKTQLARLFSEWQKSGKMEMIKKGHWKFTKEFSEKK
jgi:predicted HTH transcriptional regulator